MKKLIELDAALDAIGGVPDYDDGMVFEALSHAQRDVALLPTVDAVPVVRCRDCKHHHYSECEIPYCGMIDYGYGWKDEDFCSRGERKDGDDEKAD